MNVSFKDHQDSMIACYMNKNFWGRKVSYFLSQFLCGLFVSYRQRICTIFYWHKLLKYYTGKLSRFSDHHKCKLWVWVKYVIVVVYIDAALFTVKSAEMDNNYELWKVTRLRSCNLEWFKMLNMLSSYYIF